MGGIGCISVTANVAPALCALLHRAWDNGDLRRFAVLRDLLDPLHTVLFKESNPIPVKAALASLGLCTDEVRLPLTRATLATQERLLVVMPQIMSSEEYAAHGPPYALASRYSGQDDGPKHRTHQPRSHRVPSRTPEAAVDPYQRMPPAITVRWAVKRAGKRMPCSIF